MHNDSFITFDIFDQFPEIICAFSTRLGGKSKGVFASQNMGLKTKENRQVVERNRENFFNTLNIKENQLAIPCQIHSANIKVVNKPGIYENTDALVTSQKELFLSVQTADCFPVFLYLPDNKVIAVIHAGWRGTVAGIIDNIFQILFKKFSANPADIYTAIGPGLKKECFEVKEDAFAQFSENYLEKHADEMKRYLNLKQFILDNLLTLGINQNNIFVAPACTKCAEDTYYSYRRDGENSGRMMGIIGLRC